MSWEIVNVKFALIGLLIAKHVQITVLVPLVFQAIQLFQGVVNYAQTIKEYNV